MFCLHHVATLPYLHRLLVCLCLAFGVSSASAQLLEVKVGVYQNEPKIFMGSDGQPSGILGDLLVEMAKREGWQLKPVACDWQACLKALQAGKLDLMPDVAHTDQRAEIFDFHKVPSLLSWSQIYKHAGIPINSALDLKGKRVAVVEGSVQMTYLQSLLTGFGVEASLVPVTSFKEGFDQAKAGTVDAAAANRFYGDLQAPQFGLESTPILFQPAQLFYATQKGQHADLLSAIDRRLEIWNSNPDSVYFSIINRWTNARPQFSVPKYIWWGIAALAALLLAAVGIGVFLQREVAHKTQKLKASEDQLSTILNGVDASIYIKDTQLRYLYGNRAMCERLGVSPEEVKGKTAADLFNAENAERIQRNDLRVLEHGERVEAEVPYPSVNGAPGRTYFTVKLPLRHADGTIYAICGIATDITKHKQAEEAIHQLAFYDPLTQLPNRRLLLDRMQRAVHAHARDKNYSAMLFVDVDNFKDLNDTLGHQTGDELLRQMAERLSGCTRPQDTLARQGGDEFVVILESLSSAREEAVQQARLVAQKILGRLREPYDLGGKHYLSSVSIGVAMFSSDNVTQEDLLKQADLAMYQAKSAGRNTVRFFDPQMQELVRLRTALEADLRRGISAGEFVLYFQPQVDQHGRQFAAEALVRWQHPERGLVSPGEFIPAAESSGLILPLGDWILKAACTQLLAWSKQAETADRLIAVNVSAKQFRQQNFVDTVQQALATTGARPDRLELELTESLLVDDMESVIAKMNALKKMGVRFSLDDFGTGYSSLNMLKRLPLDQLKIDQSFVRDLLTDSQDASIVRAIVAMGTSLELEVIAEGVETAEQHQALLDLGCHHFQGYLFGRPAPA